MNGPTLYLVTNCASHSPCVLQVIATYHGKATMAAKASTVSGRIAQVTRSKLRGENSTIERQSTTRARAVQPNVLGDDLAEGRRFVHHQQEESQRSGRQQETDRSLGQHRHARAKRPINAKTDHDFGRNTMWDGFRSACTMPARLADWASAGSPIRAPLANRAMVSVVTSVKAESTVAARAEIVKIMFEAVTNPAQKPTSAENSRRAR